MEKIEFMRLWDAYAGLLTPTQREVTDLYFNYDLTLSEIAEQKGITRQAVSDCLAGCRRQLEEYEDKLGYVETDAKNVFKIEGMLKEAERWAENFAAAHPEFAADVGELVEILRKGSIVKGENLSVRSVEAFNKK